MKFTLAICIFLISSGLHAQVYFPFPTDSARWRVHYGNPGGISDDEYILSGDTTINDTIYSKLLHSFINDYWPGPPDSAFNQLMGFIREYDKRKYFRDTATDIGENLLYNFDSLMVGDTVEIYYNSDTFQVESIDSIQIGSEYRKRYKISTQFEDDYFIEGIVSTSGLFPNFDIFENDFTLTNISHLGYYIKLP